MWYSSQAYFTYYLLDKELQIIRTSPLPHDSLSTHILYSRKALKKRYQGLNLASLENSIGNTVKKEILKHLRECGFLSE